MWQPTISSDEIYHHGILNMHWGQRNGPPYPLKEGAHSAAEKKAMKKAARQERREAYKEKKRIKKEKHELKKQFKAEKRAAKKEEQRQKILNSGSLNDIRKLKGNISNQEYTEVFKRLENEQKLAEFDKKKKQTIAENIASAQKVISNVNSGSQAALQLYNRGASIYNQVAKNKGWDIQKLPIIKETDDSEEQAKKKAKDYFINKASLDEINSSKGNFTGEDLGKAVSRLKTQDTWQNYYEEHRKKKDDK